MNKAVYYGVKLSKEEAEEARAELDALAADLVWIMRHHRGQAAMVRAYVDHSGRTQVACNLYTKSAEADSAAKAVVEFRRPMDDGE